MSVSEKLHAVVARLLIAQGHRDNKKNRKALVEKYLGKPHGWAETDDEILLWKILNTSEPV